MYAVFLNDHKGDNVDFTDAISGFDAKLKFMEWWPRCEQGWSLIIKRLN